MKKVNLDSPGFLKTLYDESKKIAKSLGKSFSSFIKNANEEDIKKISKITHIFLPKYLKIFLKEDLYFVFLKNNFNFIKNKLLDIEKDEVSVEKEVKEVKKENKPIRKKKSIKGHKNVKSKIC